MPRPTASSTCSDAPCGKAGKVQNCRIGVLLTCASRLVQTLLDRALYLPASWSKGAERRRPRACPDLVRGQAQDDALRALESSFRIENILIAVCVCVSGLSYREPEA
jgi:SRSO17 transposase